MTLTLPYVCSFSQEEYLEAKNKEEVARQQLEDLKVQT